MASTTHTSKKSKTQLFHRPAHPLRRPLLGASGRHSSPAGTTSSLPGMDLPSGPSFSPGPDPPLPPLLVSSMAQTHQPSPSLAPPITPPSLLGSRPFGPTFQLAGPLGPPDPTPFSGHVALSLPTHEVLVSPDSTFSLTSALLSGEEAGAHTVPPGPMDTSPLAPDPAADTQGAGDGPGSTDSTMEDSTPFPAPLSSPALPGPVVPGQPGTC
ncbi:hypothetical protein K2173_002231 [Erythroxylum novogranatense]|uniref:Uncharacterized protein n=1 Tax=Erythroxylum novogranatense TaxID=1862640 RepID=A0AAV8T9K8_9ROSI|nr:hypothetical protein K2173_002231 [Erythroxylum novogranatense]